MMPAGDLRCLRCCEYGVACPVYTGRKTPQRAVVWLAETPAALLQGSAWQTTLLEAVHLPADACCCLSCCCRRFVRGCRRRLHGHSRAGDQQKRRRGGLPAGHPSSQQTCISVSLSLSLLSTGVVVSYVVWPCSSRNNNQQLR
ncbi:hypothetical protein H112_03742 [Trichophyton rubrum D6]|uniref:Uncharacterized protein n=3 Tax=Trichophyton TaxID=5550 RepID=A0A080WJV4_TRIRC|nr:uncharacterized protein TERG_12237 [Trichophyton rubrum CBS 118892]EZF23607.1 hypothetical protein H100_03751 [Trichophyton rubrum MR850]EZF42697.1 hypothetical protein H102_03740 [Trichophyton rubrum CBS 100081]EZF53294.1 hypothetical protein H103_03753 [Trichophyton rubrum CBS 288.86]EZF63891.1 hypothetical protein H104_03739 [Trichophyton rubrum CBS 289.86]EZF74567.1 hypothetical protein H105_03767 [Trichophyton soudanense CBS 452.61]EZF95957.1 hypothetical protein H113_03776 [Trichophy